MTRPGLDIDLTFDELAHLSEHREWDEDELMDLVPAIEDIVGRRVREANRDALKFAVDELETEIRWQTELSHRWPDRRHIHQEIISRLRIVANSLHVMSRVHESSDGRSE